MIGNEPKRAATASRSAARLRCCHSGARAPGRRRGQQQRPRGRLAEPRREQRGRPRAGAPPGARPRRGRARAAPGRAARRSRASAPRSRRRLHIISTSRPRSSRSAPSPPSPTARGRGRRTARAPTAASRPLVAASARSTMVRSSGTTPVARCWSARYCSRFSAARRVEAVLARSGALAASAGAACRSSRVSSPIARPSSTGRPAPSPFQNGILPGSPGAGDDEHAVVGDLLDAPGRGAEQERLAGPALEHHLLVELADPARRRARRRRGTRRTGRGRGWCRR